MSTIELPRILFAFRDLSPHIAKNNLGGSVRAAATMNSHDEKVIEFSRKRILLFFLVLCMFVGLGVWFLSVDEATIQSLYPHNKVWFVRGIGVAMIVFCVAWGIFGVKLIHKKAGLILNSAGMVDHSSGMAAGFVPWSEITGIKIHGLSINRQLDIKVRDPEKYIGRGGALRRALNKFNYKFGGSPVAINPTMLNITLDELVSLFQQYLQKYGDVPRRQDSIP